MIKVALIGIGGMGMVHFNAYKNIKDAKIIAVADVRYDMAKEKVNDESINIYTSMEEYGRCIYRCDNDVCDHQVASLVFKNGATAVFTVSAFSLENTRTLKIMGTEGEIGGCMEKGEIVLKTFSDMKETKFHVTHDGTKHCGGDSGLIKHFAKLLEQKTVKNDLSVFKSHKMAFLAEKSRLKNKGNL